MLRQSLARASKLTESGRQAARTFPSPTRRPLGWSGRPAAPNRLCSLGDNHWGVDDTQNAIPVICPAHADSVLEAKFPDQTLCELKQRWGERTAMGRMFAMHTRPPIMGQDGGASLLYDLGGGWRAANHLCSHRGYTR